MDLSTKYLGLELPHPLMPGASPMADNLDTVKRLEDAGAAAIVMRSLFEEQITLDQMTTFQDIEEPAGAFAEALSYFPDPPDFVVGPEEYLEKLKKIKEAVSVPVIASLNGVTPRGWLEYARLIQEAGADAMELNVYLVATDPAETGEDVEKRTVDIIRKVKAHVDIPVAAKISPFYSSVANLAKKLEDAGADGLVLFNRFYQPDIDVDELTIVPQLKFSDSSTLLLRMHWLAILSGKVAPSLAASGGVHTSLDAIKAVMSGAHAVQMVSALLAHSPEYLRVVLEGMERWMEDHEYESLQQMQGSMSLEKSPDPAAFERVNYMRVLQSWRG
jgi:dihydroorotate dehydrogenase (fumarate)